MHFIIINGNIDGIK